MEMTDNTRRYNVAIGSMMSTKAGRGVGEGLSLKKMYLSRDLGSVRRKPCAR